MNNETKRLLALLELHRPSIVIDLEVHDVIPGLLEELVLDHGDKQRIEHEKTYEERAGVLLDIIKTKTESGNGDAIPIFVASLREKYSWLYSKLTQDELDNGVGTMPFSVPVLHSPWRPRLGSGTKTLALGGDEQKIKRILEGGGVHGLPRFMVERPELLDHVRAELAVLEPKGYVVLTGMAGCGKSVLAMQALHSKELLTKVYGDGIFWLSIGKECSETKDAILAKMRSLCDRLGETRAPSNLDHGADLLRTAFLRRPDSLLILDDVWRPEVVRAFDVGCRTLVTTRDVSVMDAAASAGRMQQIRVSDGFTEKESLSLFCQSLGCGSVDEIPAEEAEAIHSECKGSPMVISLISALFHDHDVGDRGRWGHYLSFLRKRKWSQMRRVREYEHESVLDAIALSVDALEAGDQDRYLDFALFQDDVGIPCPVLVTLWGLGRYEVEDIMSRLVRKSLAAEEYDPVRKCRVYSVHDLQLDYLKYRLCDCENGREAEQNLHQRFVDQYLRLSGSSGAKHVEKLPDDGYIHSYIGYHLHKAGGALRELFPLVYLNLLFVGEKMRLAGPADLLIDLRKYKEFILSVEAPAPATTTPTPAEELFEEITTLAQSAGHRLYNQPDADVVQIVLQMPRAHLPRIYSLALNLARRTPSRLYLEWSNASSAAASGRWKNAESVVLCSDVVRCVRFIDANHFLAGLSNGTVELCHLASTRICHVYGGHGGPVQALDIDVDVDGLFFVSGSEDGTCKLWRVEAALRDKNDPADGVQASPRHNSQNSGSGSSDSNSTPSPSPKIRPDFWAGASVAATVGRDESVLTFEFHTAPITHVEFSCFQSPEGRQLISTSLNEILIWSPVNGQVLRKISPDVPSASPGLGLGPSFHACHFPRSASALDLDFPFLLMSCENQVVIFALETPNLFSSVEGHLMRIVSLLQLPPGSSYELDGAGAFCTVSENEIGLWKVLQGKSAVQQRAQTHRTRSLSPRRPAPAAPNGSRNGNVNSNQTQTQVDAVPMLEGNSNGLPDGEFQFLHPNRQNLAPRSSAMSGSSYVYDTSNGRDSPDSASGAHSHSRSCSVPAPTAFIENGTNYLQILREAVFPRACRPGHSRGLFTCAALTESGELLAVGTSDRKILLWHVPSRKWVGEFSSQGYSGVTCLNFSPVDRWALLSGSEDHTVMLWDLEDEHRGKKAPRLGMEFASTFILGSDGGPGCFLSVFSTDRNSVQVHKDERCLFTLKFETLSSSIPPAITALAIRRGGAFAIIANEAGHIYKLGLQSIVDGYLDRPLKLRQIGSTVEGEHEKITRVVFNKGGSHFAAATDAGNVLLFKEFDLMRTIKREGNGKEPQTVSVEIVGLHFPFDSTLAIVYRSFVRIEALSHGEEQQNRPKTLKGWKFEDVAVLVTCSTISGDGSCLALGTRRNGIVMLTLAPASGVVTASRVLSRPDSGITCLEFNSDRSRLAAGHENGLVTVWKLSEAEKKYQEELDLIFHKSRVRAMAFSAPSEGKGQWLASCGDKLAFWTLDKPRPRLSPSSSPKPPTFMEERRRKKSGDNSAAIANSNSNSSRPSSRLSLEIGEGVKIGRRGKRELLQSFFFRGAHAQQFVADPYFRRFAIVDESGLLYMIEVLGNSLV